jgi:hypothetical protein
MNFPVRYLQGIIFFASAWSQHDDHQFASTAHAVSIRTKPLCVCPRYQGSDSRDCGMISPPANTSEANSRFCKKSNGFTQCFQRVGDAIDSVMRPYGIPTMPHFFLDCGAKSVEVQIAAPAEPQKWPAKRPGRGLHRETVIRPLAAQPRLSVESSAEAAYQLGLSRSFLYKLLQRHRRQLHATH